MQPAHKEHALRFQKEERSNYSEADLKVLVTIGSDADDVETLMPNIEHVRDVAVVGFVVSPSYDSYNMFVRHANETDVKGPLFLVCGRVAKTLVGIEGCPFESVQSSKKRRLS